MSSIDDAADPAPASAASIPAPAASTAASAPVPEVAAAAGGSQPAPGVSVLGAALISAAVSATLLLSGLLIYDRHFAQHPRPLATVDIDAIVSARELAFVERLSRAGATDADHGQTFDLINAFAAELDAAVNQATRECGCDILVRGALVGRPAQDLTDKIASRLGITVEAVTAGRSRIRSSIAAAGVATQPPRLPSPPPIQPSTVETRP